MDFLIAILLGIVQGATAFLPVSSTGHLIVLERLTGITVPALTFHVFLRAGSSIAVMLAFRDDFAAAGKELSAAFRRQFGRKNSGTLTEKAGAEESDRGREQRMLSIFGAATIPAIVLGILCFLLVRSLSDSLLFAGAGLLLTGLLLFVTDRIEPGKGTMRDLRRNDLWLIGAFQCFSIFPGVSQFAAAFCAGIYSGLGKKNAIHLASLVAVPVSLCAMIGVVPVSLLTGEMSLRIFGICMLGMVSAAVSGTLFVGSALQLVRRASLTSFSRECLAAGLFAMVLTVLL